MTINKLIIVVILLIVGLTTIACSKNQTTPSENQAWINPGKVKINNYYAGRQVNWELTIHNNNNRYYVDTVDITTSAGEMEVLVPLKAKPFGDLNDIKISSSLNENLKIESYIEEKKSLNISGFKANCTRQISLTYPYFTQYSLYCRAPDNPLEGYKSIVNNEWISFSDKSPIMAPGETRDVTVVLNTVKETQLPDKKWEFWIGVKEVGNKNTISVELCSRCLITMK